MSFPSCLDFLALSPCVPQAGEVWHLLDVWRLHLGPRPSSHSTNPASRPRGSWELIWQPLNWPLLKRIESQNSGSCIFPGLRRPMRVLQPRRAAVIKAMRGKRRPLSISSLSFLLVSIYSCSSRSPWPLQAFFHIYPTWPDFPYLCSFFLSLFYLSSSSSE